MQGLEQLQALYQGSKPDDIDLDRVGADTTKGAAYSSRNEYLSVKWARLETTLDKQGYISDIFKGCVIFVNGRTKPSLTTLRRLIGDNHGVFAYHYTSSVTHIITAVIPDHRVREFGDRACVSPDWVVESCKAGEKLPTAPFAVTARQTHETRPSFVDQYYGKSRLHHLSTWKTEIQAWLETNPPAGPLPSTQGRPVFYHVDMDCFFASVAMADDPTLLGHPLAITHGQGATAAVSACNYPAREFGVKANMNTGDALDLCPNLRTRSYDYPRYEAVSRQVYALCGEMSSALMPLSIDELALNMTGLESESTADSIRDRIRAVTGCNASIGVGYSLLSARLALKRAKPDGVYRVSDPTQFRSDFTQEAVGDLPGIGWKFKQKMHELGIHTIGDVQQADVSLLTDSFGSNRGLQIHQSSLGLGGKEFKTVRPSRKTVSLSVRWGVRFTDHNQVVEFIRKLCDELWIRISTAKVKIESVSLTVALRHPEAPVDPSKYLGSGRTVDRTASSKVSHISKDSVTTVVIGVYRAMPGIDPAEIRGIGLTGRVGGAGSGGGGVGTMNIGQFLVETVDTGAELRWIASRKAALPDIAKGSVFSVEGVVQAPVTIRPVPATGVTRTVSKSARPVAGGRSKAKARPGSATLPPDWKAIEAGVDVDDVIEHLQTHGANSQRLLNAVCLQLLLQGDLAAITRLHAALSGVGGLQFNEVEAMVRTRHRGRLWARSGASVALGD
ncbi:DNA repair protein REV1 [Carpediemonas membranifera]|uniref:DNA repair protein REV1 n=1 Tax=Carpediemonas membranifera TaxID=201153 RepID=A0A8J6BVR7_9EUKA|nr:DNA repair protein REV1 [Carpediemonas membranifera]|eukprot:KAG9391686.1 DNA repair protein REV1 [Carpediemonas membranifera]